MIGIGHSEAINASFQHHFQTIFAILSLYIGNNWNIVLNSPHPFLLGLMIGTCGSLVNTYIFEIYLAKSMHKETTQMSTGSTWRYLVAVIACVLWLFFKEHINIIGVLIGLMISYIVIILRPLLQRE